VKPVEFVGTALEDLRSFPPVARRAAGYQLGKVQEGGMPEDWKPLPAVGPGANEIRIHTEAEHRVIYVAKFEKAVYVLHAFQKTSRKTAKKDLDLAKARYRQLANRRRLASGNQ
jgi:phage-related protein